MLYLTPSLSFKFEDEPMCPKWKPPSFYKFHKMSVKDLSQNQILVW